MYFSVHCSATQSQDEHNSSRVATEEEDDASQPSSHLLKANETDSFHGLMDLLCCCFRASPRLLLLSPPLLKAHRNLAIIWQEGVVFHQQNSFATRIVISFNLDTNDMHYHNIIIRSYVASSSLSSAGGLYSLPRLGMGLYKMPRKNSITKDSHAAQLGSSTRPL